jgi:hypothetical protein
MDLGAACHLGTTSQLVRSINPLKDIKGVVYSKKNDSKMVVNWAGCWFGTFFYFFHILGIIIPTDEHIFQRV